METFNFPLFNSTVHIALFTNVQSAGDILSRIQAAAKLEGDEGEKERSALNFAFVESKMITSINHLQTAIIYALLADSQGSLRTKTIHSEIIWALNPSHNISEAFKLFGISAKTKSLLLVQVQKADASQSIPPSPQEVEAVMETLVNGTLSPISAISSCTDWTVVRKVYKLNDDLALKGLKDPSDISRKIDAIVSSLVATKNVQM